jgi:hypothetical protein
MSAKDPVSVVSAATVSDTNWQSAEIDCSAFTSADLYIIVQNPPASADVQWNLAPIDPQTGDLAGYAGDGSGLYHGNLSSGGYTGTGAGVIQGDGSFSIAAALSSLPGVRYRLDYGISGSGAFSSTVTVTLVGAA